jgi:hypothetical protein
MAFLPNAALMVDAPEHMYLETDTIVQLPRRRLAEYRAQQVAACFCRRQQEAWAAKSVAADSPHAKAPAHLRWWLELRATLGKASQEQFENFPHLAAPGDAWVAQVEREATRAATRGFATRRAPRNAQY